jgi:hypothetical protein
VTDFVMNKDQEPLERRADQLREDLSQVAPERLAELTTTSLEEVGKEQFFHFPYWGEPVELSCQDFIARAQETKKPLPPVHQAMILYYFSYSRGSRPPGKWISFSELEDGQFYNAAFQGYTSKKILQVLGEDYQTFEHANQELGGEKVNFGDSAYRYQILPRVALLLVLWRGDEEFPPSYKILFEDIADEHLPTDGCAILASMLTGKLMAAA